MREEKETRPERVGSGVPGLDEVLCGGFVPKRGYLVRGGPGTGKTTLGMQFLHDGATRGERALFITLGENEESLRANAAGIGLDTGAIEFLDLSPESDFFSADRSYALFSPAEVERDPLTKRIVERVSAIKPRRVFLDSTSHLRYLALDAQQFRKQLLSFIRFLLELEATVVFTSESTASTPDDDVMYLSDGVINLSLAPAGRKLEVTKFRGSDFKTGLHTLRLTGRGAEVHPVLRPGEHGRPFAFERVGSGSAAVDALLGGGIERGTVTILTGPAGVGKTTLGTQFLREAARNGERSVLFAFEEAPESILRRADGMGSPLREMVEAGALSILQVEPLLHSADEIANMVRSEVEGRGARHLMLDSIAGYKLTVQDGALVQCVRALFKYLTNMGVTVIAVNETDAIVGEFRGTEAGLSFMADNVVFLRYLELWGEMRKAIGVLKKRMGDFERQLREFAITPGGVRVGEPLVNLRGILSGTPAWVTEPPRSESPDVAPGRT